MKLMIWFLLLVPSLCFAQRTISLHHLKIAPKDVHFSLVKSDTLFLLVYAMQGNALLPGKFMSVNIRTGECDTLMQNIGTFRFNGDRIFLLSRNLRAFLLYSFANDDIIRDTLPHYRQMQNFGLTRNYFAYEATINPVYCLDSLFTYYNPCRETPCLFRFHYFESGQDTQGTCFIDSWGIRTFDYFDDQYMCINGGLYSQWDEVHSATNHQLLYRRSIPGRVLGRIDDYLFVKRGDTILSFKQLTPIDTVYLPPVQNVQFMWDTILRFVEFGGERIILRDRFRFYLSTSGHFSQLSPSSNSELAGLINSTMQRLKTEIFLLFLCQIAILIVI